ncbi:MAG: hypothetical protein WC897_05385 [Candidatus Gracilibacteria bacterium]
MVGVNQSGKELDLNTVAEGLGKKALMDYSNLYQTLKDWGDKHPDEFKAKLSQWRPDVKDFIDADGKIKLEELKGRLNVMETMALLFDQLFVAQFLRMGFFGKRDYKKMTYEETVSYFEVRQDAKKSGALTRGLDGNIVWPGEGPFGELTALWDQLNIFQDKKEKGKKDTFPLPTGTRLIMPSTSPSGDGKAKFAPAKFSLLKAYCESIGIKLSRLEVGESTDKTLDKDKEVQYVPVPDGLPTKSVEGKDKVDMEALKWYASLWEDQGAHGQWVSVSTLVASVLYLKGDGALTPVQAFQKAGIPSAPQELVDLVQTVELPSQVADPAGSAKPAEPAKPA